MSDSQQIKIQLRGWPAVVAAVVALAVAGFVFLQSRTLKQEDLRVLVDRLESDYARHGLASLQPAVEAGDDDATAAVAKEIADRFGHVKLVSIRARGSSTEPVVCVEIEVDGKEPPDGRPVRYFVLRYSTLTGWRLVRETSAFAYYAKLF